MDIYEEAIQIFKITLEDPNTSIESDQQYNLFIKDNLKEAIELAISLLEKETLRKANATDCMHWECPSCKKALYSVTIRCPRCQQKLFWEAKL